MSNKMKIFLGIGAIIVLIILWPLLLIWALNTLFGMSILYTPATWLAAIILGGAVSYRQPPSKQ